MLAQDRRTFDDLVAFVLAYINDWQTRSGGRNGKVVLLGESFGGMLAAGVAITNRTQLQGLVLANPATSFDQTDWPTVGWVCVRVRVCVCVGVCVCVYIYMYIGPSSPPFRLEYPSRKRD